MVVWSLGAYCPVLPTGQAHKSKKPFSCLTALKWITMNCNLESKRPPSQLGLEISDRDRRASYVSPLRQPLRGGKHPTSLPVWTIRTQCHRDHASGECASNHMVKRRSKSTPPVSIPVWTEPASEVGREASADLCHLLAWEYSPLEPRQSHPGKAGAACSLHTIRIHFHMFLSSSLQDNCSCGAQGVGGQEVCAPVYQLTKREF